MEDFIKINDAARSLGISRVFLYKLRKQNKLKIYKLGGASFVKKSELESAFKTLI
jgi:excisionase family DNA binding protein